MRAAEGCKLFGAYGAAAGVKDAVILLHSVVGCNFGTMSFQIFQDMTDIRQACTVISDDEVIMGGEASVLRALNLIEKEKAPEVIFVITGCVSEMIEDDIASVCRNYQGSCRVVHVPAAGFCGGISDGIQEFNRALLAEMEPAEVRTKIPAVNILGPRAGDYRIGQDKKMFEKLLGDQVKIGLFTADCRFREIQKAPEAWLNLVIGEGEDLAQEMKEHFGIPYVCMNYPYGLTGADRLWSILERELPVSYKKNRIVLEKEVTEGLKKIHPYLQAFYGSSAAVIAEHARAEGLRFFLREELGMNVTVCAAREDTADLADVYDAVRARETAMLFGSSFEADLAEELSIPLIRMDYPVFDEICISNRPTIGGEGTLCMVEDMVCQTMRARYRKGPLCQ